MSKGKDFENFIYFLESVLNQNEGTKVEKNVHLRSKEGTLRQIDVLLTHIVDRHMFRTAIECKNWKRKIDPGQIEQFCSKLRSLNIDKGIIVSKSGFTKGLIKESNTYPNSTLYTFEEIDKLKANILSEYKIGGYKIKYFSNDWTVIFLDSKSIHTDMQLYSKLKFDDNDKSFDIAEIAQDYLLHHQEIIINSIVNKVGIANKILTDLYLEIHFPFPPFFEKDQLKSFIKGFKCQIETTLEMNVLEFQKIYEYRNITEKKRIAIVLELMLDEKTKKLFKL